MGTLCVLDDSSHAWSLVLLQGLSLLSQGCLFLSGELDYFLKKLLLVDMIIHVSVEFYPSLLNKEDVLGLIALLIN